MRAGQGQRHQPGARGQHRVAELPGQRVAEAAGAHARDRQPAAGDHQRRRDEASLRRVQAETPVVEVLDALDAAMRAHLHAGGRAFGQQHRHHLLAGVVAEQLAEFLLVVGDAVAFDQFDEMPRRVARQRRLAEVRVRRQVVGRRRAGIGEVAASAAGHQDLLADLVGMVDHQHAQPALASRDRRHQACGAGADDDGVVGGSAHAHSREGRVWRRSGRPTRSRKLLNTASA